MTSAKNATHQFLKTLQPNDSVRSIYLVRQKAMATGKTGKPYVTVSLMDRTGTIDGRVWDNAEDIAAKFDIEDFVLVTGSVTLYQNRRQLVIRDMERKNSKDVDSSLFLPKTEFDIETMFKQLKTLLDSIENPDIRWLCLELLNHPEIAPGYKMAPAARTIHHAWVGGLLEHSLSVVRIADFFGKFYPMVDRSYLMFGAAFHDFGKIFELTYDTKFAYSLEGRLVGHLVTGAQWIDAICAKRPGFPDEVRMVCKHLILSHHGKLEFGSPKEPMTLEAVILGMIDNLDSRVQGIATFMENEEVPPGGWSGHHAFFETYFFCPESSRMTQFLAQRKTKTGEEDYGTLVPEDVRAKLNSMVKK